MINNVYFRIFNKKTAEKFAYFFDGGIISLLRDMNRGKKILHDPIYIHKQVDDKEVEVAIQYNLFTKRKYSLFCQCYQYS